jgi:hypothetical protein
LSLTARLAGGRRQTRRAGLMPARFCLDRR